MSEYTAKILYKGMTLSVTADISGRYRAATHLDPPESPNVIIESVYREDGTEFEPDFREKYDLSVLLLDKLQKEKEKYDAE